MIALSFLAGAAVGAAVALGVPAWKLARYAKREGLWPS